MEYFLGIPDPEPEILPVRGTLGVGFVAYSLTTSFRRMLSPASDTAQAAWPC